jgi:hypothetical protein
MEYQLSLGHALERELAAIPDDRMEAGLRNTRGCALGRKRYNDLAFKDVRALEPTVAQAKIRIVEREPPYPTQINPLAAPQLWPRIGFGRMRKVHVFYEVYSSDRPPR